ncbi:hypothetical protein ACOSQ2_030660 [Xanthoceras sorbifolium]
MGKKLKVEVVFGATNYSIAFLLLLVWLFAAAFFYVNPLGSCKYQLTYWRNSLIRSSSIKGDVAIEEETEVIKVVKEDPFKFHLRRLVRDEDKMQLENTGFSCHTQISEVCVSDRPVIIDNYTIHIPSSQPNFTRFMKPYAEVNAHYLVSSIQIVAGGDDNQSNSSPACHITHDIPAVVFSGRGFAGNLYHELSEIIIPLFITTFHFRSQVKFVITDFNPRWVKKYTRILNRLSGYEPINPAENGTVHCFPGGVIGLNYYGLLTLNSTDDIPGKYSMADFRKFLRESYGLKYENVFQIKRERPVLLLISRKNSRTFLNEREMVALMEEVGFEVVVVKPSGMSDLAKFARVVNTCSVMVGAHGAGLTNEVFLPSGAVMVQVVLLGLEWGSTSYYGAPASDMGLNYLEYKIEPEESTLLKKFGRDHPVITDPGSIGAKGYYAFRSVYIDGQNVIVNLTRFRETLVQAMELVDL